MFRNYGSEIGYHRKNPGIQKTQPINLSPWLQDEMILPAIQ